MFWYPFFHHWFVAPSFWLKLNLHSAVRTFLLFPSSSQAFSTKYNQRMKSGYTIPKYCQLHTALPLIKTRWSWYAPYFTAPSLSAQVFPSSNTKSSGIWSMFAMSLVWQIPHLWKRDYFEWNFVTAGADCFGSVCAVCVFLRRATSYRRQNLINHWSELLSSLPG